MERKMHCIRHHSYKLIICSVSIKQDKKQQKFIRMRLLKWRKTSKTFEFIICTVTFQTMFQLSSVVFLLLQPTNIPSSGWNQMLGIPCGSQVSHSCFFGLGQEYGAHKSQKNLLMGYIWLYSAQSNYFRYRPWEREKKKKGKPQQGYKHPHKQSLSC